MEKMYLVNKNKSLYITIDTSPIILPPGEKGWHISDIRGPGRLQTPYFNRDEELFSWLKKNEFWHMEEEDLAKYFLIS